MQGRANVMLILGFNDMSRVMRKPAFCICKNKVAYATAEQRTPIVNSLYFLNQSLLAISIGHTYLVGNSKAGFFMSWLKLYALKSKLGMQSAFVDTGTRLDSLTSDVSFRT